MIYRRLISILGWVLAFQTILWAQVGSLNHTVANGETLYRISKNYGVTAEQIVQLNPGLTAENLKSGSVIRIPATGISQKDNSGRAREHKVKKGETQWSIAKDYGITLEELKAANPEMSAENYQLKKGRKILIPAPKAVVVPKAAPVYAGYPSANVAVLLPLTAKGAEGARSLEFYRGLLMAADRMKEQGKTIIFYAVDEGKPEEDVTGKLEKIRNSGANLIIGPLYPEHFQAATSFAAGEGMKLLVPFSSKVTQVETNSSVMLLNVPDKYKGIGAADIFKRHFREGKVIFLKSDGAGGNERLLSGELLARLKAEGYKVTELPAGYTDDCLASALSLKERNILVPDMSDKAGVKALVKRLAKVRTDYPGFNVSLIGYPEWQAYADELAAEYYKLDTYIFANYYYNVYAPATKNFVHDYKSWFHTDMLNVYPRMALLGHDCGLVAIEGLLKEGKDFPANSFGVPQGMLQSEVAFGKVGSNGGFINNSIWLIHYKLDRTIEKIQAK